MSDERRLVRLSKVLSRRGLCSRREAERWIEEGRVTVDGDAVEVARKVDPAEDAIRLDGKPLPDKPPHVYYLLYKPRGYITGRNDPKGRKSVLEFAEALPFRVEPVGRLDYETEGALLLTNDGEVAHGLTHPSRHVPKRYRAKVYRTPSPAKLRSIEKGQVYLEDGPIAPAKVRVLETTKSSNAWVEITVTEGRNRLIRRLFHQLHHPVSKLRRESFATLSLRGMERGQIRPLTHAEIRRIRDIADGVRPKRAGRKKHGKGFAKAKPKRVRPQNRKRRLAKKRRKRP